MYPKFGNQPTIAFILQFMPGGARPSFQSAPASFGTNDDECLYITDCFILFSDKGSLYVFWLYTGYGYRYTTEHVITSGDPETEYL